MSTVDYTPTAKICSISSAGGFITTLVNGIQTTIRSENPLWNQAVEALKNLEWEQLYSVMKPANAVAKATLAYDVVEVKDNVVYYDGEEVNGYIVDKILEFVSGGHDVLNLLKFLAKLQSNPSKRAVDELYTFLEHKHLPITVNGNFLAYKNVTADYKDWHTRRFDNTIGETPTMPRNKVDDDKNRGCSSGFHAGTLEYASTFGSGGHLMIVEINPADVVSVPLDCNCQKLRTCKYKVVDEYTAPLDAPVYASRYADDYDYADDDVDDDDYDY